MKLKDYVYRLSHGAGAAGSDYPWNYMVILGYMAVFFTALPMRNNLTPLSQTGRLQRGAGIYMKNAVGAAWKLIFLFAVRTALWMYILMRDRAPERITHSLYLMELCILAAMVLVQWSEIGKIKIKRMGGILVAGCFGLSVLAVFHGSVKAVSLRQAEREKVNGLYRELYTYLSEEENAGNFYFIDVYSSVSDGGIPYSEKMFQDVDNSLDNYDIMGGWACKSPLQRKKLALFGIENMEAALKDREDVYFIRKKSEDMQWIFDYYEDHGTPVGARLVKQVAGVFEIYALSGQRT